MHGFFSWDAPAGFVPDEVHVAPKLKSDDKDRAS